MKATPLLGLLACSVFFGGCTGGTETGNPAQPAQMGLSLHTSDPMTADVVGGRGGVIVEAAWIGMSDVSFVVTGLPDEEPEEVEIEGLIVTDLADTRLGLQQFLLVPGSYSRVRAELTPVALPLPVGAPAELEGSSLVVLGLTPLGRRFTLVVREEMEFAIVAAGVGFTVEPLTAQLVISFDIAQWFENLDLDALPLRPDGTMLIDETSNPGTLMLFEASLLLALELGLDRNGNATLEDDEERLARGESP